MIVWLLLAALLLPAAWAGVVVKLADPFLSRAGGHPPRPGGDCFGLGLMWWCLTAAAWVTSACAFGATAAAAGPLPGWAEAIATFAWLHLCATGAAAFTLLPRTGEPRPRPEYDRTPASPPPPTGVSPVRAALICAAAAAVWLVGLAGLLFGTIWTFGELGAW